MQRSSQPLRRLAYLLRPPKSLTASPRALTIRPFTHNSQLLLVGSISPRPQLPFLFPATQPSNAKGNPLTRSGTQWQLSRLVSTKVRQDLRVGLWLGSKFIALYITVVLLGGLILAGFREEYYDRKYPSPPEWSWWTRFYYRAARTAEEAGDSGDAGPDEAKAWSAYSQALERLESPEFEGKDLVRQGEGGILVLGVGSTGFDITNKSDDWRRGYFLTLMGSARCAEVLDGYVCDSTRGLVFPAVNVIGPSNPRPQPVPIGSNAPPLEEDCRLASPPPETYYMKVLTTLGFTTRERLEAAIAYADWLDYKGLPDSASEMHKWAIDIATSSLDASPTDVIDGKTGILVPDLPAKFLTPNTLLAATSLAIHHARNSNLSSALPIFVSVLRGRKSLAEPTPLSKRSPSADPRGFLSIINATLFPPPYPTPPPAGDDPAHRVPSSICAEAGLMAHIGEVLFASSHHDDGLAWTRDAVDVAEAQLRELIPDSAATSDTTDSEPSSPPYRAPSRSDRNAPNEGDGPPLERCTECLETGIHNWRMMVLQLAEEEEKRREEVKAKRQEILHQLHKQQQQRASDRHGLWSWLWPTGNEVAEAVDEDDGGQLKVAGRWEAELEVVERRLRRVDELLANEKERRRRSGVSLFEKIFDG